MSDIEQGLIRAIAPLSEVDDTIRMESVALPSVPLTRKPTIMQMAIDEGLPGESVWETVGRLVRERNERERVARELWADVLLTVSDVYAREYEAQYPWLKGMESREPTDG